jgi:23S rRNA pseudouridine1911/1915/1917 synthase
MDEQKAPNPVGDSDADALNIVFEDDHMLVVDKPVGMVVHPAPGHEEGTLVQLLAGRVAGGSDARRPGIVHRLDRKTSGLIIVAKTPQAHDALTKLIAKRQINREYLALVSGHLGARTGVIDAPIGRDRRLRTRVSIESDVARVARTQFEVEQILPKSTLVRVRLETGRTHQIRVHMAAIGHPIIGDPEYGSAGYGLTRQFLHATRLTLTHPITGQTLDLNAPLPLDLQAALEAATAKHTN